MLNGFFIITGTSRGIGEALAAKIVRQGHTVLGVSRTRSENLGSEKKYHHHSFDLTDTSRMGEIIDKVDQLVDNQKFDFVCLVNNASATEPIGPIEKCRPTEIESHVTIGLLGPMMLTTLFMEKFQKNKLRKKVVFISSGLGSRPMAHSSVYCTSKAGINMFTQCIGLEQKDKAHPFEVVAIGPGMVDTRMQQAMRSKTTDEFAAVDFFKQAFAEGKLQLADKVAEKIYSIIENRCEPGRYVSVSEL
jgi:benzil reductase ((S)-benzoin forming)